MLNSDPSALPARSPSIELAERGWVQALLSVLPAAVTFFMAYLWLGGSLFNVAAMSSFLVEPLIVAQKGYTGDPGPNLMEIIQASIAGHHPPSWLFATAVYVVPVAISAWLIFYISRQKEVFPSAARIALLALISLAMFKHHSYDNALLIFPAAFALRNIRQHAGKIVLALVCFSWLVDRVVGQFTHNLPGLYLVEFAVLVWIGILLHRIASGRGSEMREPVLASD
ncbi:MAG: hypothetical protein JO300_13380 [Silvibacterium sp.]|nr:hypothetical protein [Silvibacterium sp.]MBV8436962.1 hypothetical protein [Silvibacterium sp.]